MENNLITGRVLVISIVFITVGKCNWIATLSGWNKKWLKDYGYIIKDIQNPFDLKC